MIMTLEDGNYPIPCLFPKASGGRPPSPMGKNVNPFFLLRFAFGLEILVIKTLLYLAINKKKRIVIPTERTPGANGGI